MFAPTFREGAIDGKRIVFSQEWSLDFKRLLQNLGKRFGGEWYLCLRVHPQLASKMKEYKDHELQDRLIDVSQDDDMYEILAAMDALLQITQAQQWMPVLPICQFSFMQTISRNIYMIGEVCCGISLPIQTRQLQIIKR